MRGAEDLSKLPRWAQRRIEVAERARDDFRAELEAGPADSDTFINPYGAEQPIGTHTRVAFAVGETRHGSKIALHVHTDEDGRGNKYIELHGSHGGIRVEPRATNVAFIHLLDN